MQTDGVQLLSIVLAVSVSVGLSLGFNTQWWMGVASGVGTLVGLALWVRVASDDGLLAALTNPPALS